MSLEQVACEDLKAFERRLTEIISSAHPSAIRWRVLLLVASVCVACGALWWLGDPQTAEVPFLASLMNHPFFSLSTVFIIFLFFSWCASEGGMDNVERELYHSVTRFIFENYR